MEHVADAWEDSRRIGLRSTSVSEAKKEVGGEWGDEKVIFGFRANVAEETIGLPKSNIDGTRRLAEELILTHQISYAALRQFKDFAENANIVMIYGDSWLALWMGYWDVKTPAVCGGVRRS